MRLTRMNVLDVGYFFFIGFVGRAWGLHSWQCFVMIFVGMIYGMATVILTWKGVHR